MLTVSGPPWLFPTVAPSGFFSPEYTGSTQSMHTEVHPWHSTLSTEAGRTVTHVALVCVSPSSVTVSSPPLPGNPQSPRVIVPRGAQRGPQPPGVRSQLLAEFRSRRPVFCGCNPTPLSSSEAGHLTRLLWLQELCGAPRPGWTSQARGRLARELVPYNSRSLHSPLMS